MQGSPTNWVLICGFFIILLATVGSIVSSLLTGSGKGICLVTVQLKVSDCMHFFFFHWIYRQKSAWLWWKKEGH